MSTGINKITNPEVALQNKIQTQQASNQTQRAAEVQKLNLKDTQQSPNSGYKKQLSPDELKRVISKINDNVSKLNKDVRFTYNDTLKSLVVKVVDSKTGKVIREIPPQEVINLQKKLSEVVGIIFDSKEVEK
ncbi:flagellar protein FlaG [Hippea maritima]|uniref:Flagellar protein FlaG protein n=1 Tax=Hippea maritima (strain ATCC 700847 / DSM 10411 / MH2) TaxID=760142 RepID=F2LVR2_HIPMA|nr:flagellar protein FlaG [Hippea maritima]AEA33846.1 flagellar protein FlaG protein [Hippea maritima DSM 10411]